LKNPSLINAPKTGRPIFPNILFGDFERFHWVRVKQKFGDRVFEFFRSEGGRPPALVAASQAALRMRKICSATFSY
jgi:hypothetical protein